MCAGMFSYSFHVFVQLFYTLFLYAGHLRGGLNQIHILNFMYNFVWYQFEFGFACKVIIGSHYISKLELKRNSNFDVNLELGLFYIR